MITLLYVHWHRLRRDTAALALTFVLPVMFFSIFAGVFGGLSDDSPPQLSLGVVDLDQTPLSQRFANALDQLDLLSVTVFEDRETALRAVRQGEYGVALVLQSGFAQQYGTFDPQQSQTELLYDAANPALRYSVRGILQGMALGVAPDVLLQRATDYLASQNAPMTEEQQRVFNELLPYLRGERSWHTHIGGENIAPLDAEAEATTGVSVSGANPMAISLDADVLPLLMTDVRRVSSKQEDDVSNVSPVAYYAAGIGVMFLLFSMAGASSLLLEDRENGTLERLLNAGVSLPTQLLGHWLFFTVLGTVQVWLMFAWGALVFGLDFSDGRTILGVLLFTPMTAAAACAFAMTLATSCDTRAQLNGVSSIVILLMSALGGSMVPRFLMPSWMESVALFTFNGWALDGFLKIFWYVEPDAALWPFLSRLTPQFLMLTLMTMGFAVVAHRLARRWAI